MATSMESSSSSSARGFDSVIGKAKILIGALNLLSRNLLQPPDVLRIVSEIYHDQSGDEKYVEFLNCGDLIKEFAAMQIQQINNLSCSDHLKSLEDNCLNTSIQRLLSELLALPANTGEEMKWKMRCRVMSIQTIAPIAYLIENRGVTGPHLVIAPESFLPWWQIEFRSWLPSMTTVLYDGGPEQRKTIREGYSGNGKFNVLLTHYDLMIRDQKVLSKVCWYFLFVDEVYGRLTNRVRIPLDTTKKAYDYRCFLLVQNLIY